MRGPEVTDRGMAGGESRTSQVMSPVELIEKPVGWPLMTPVAGAAYPASGAGGEAVRQGVAVGVDGRDLEGPDAIIGDLDDCGEVADGAGVPGEGVGWASVHQGLGAEVPVRLFLRVETRAAALHVREEFAGPGTSRGL